MAGCFACLGGGKRDKQGNNQLKNMEANLPAFVQKVTLDDKGAEAKWVPPTTTNAPGVGAGVGAKAASGAAPQQLAHASSLGSNANSSPVKQPASNGQAYSLTPPHNGQPASNGQPTSNMGQQFRSPEQMGNGSAHLNASPPPSNNLGATPERPPTPPSPQHPPVDLRSLVTNIRERKQGGGEGMISADLTMQSSSVVGAPIPLGANPAQNRKAPPPSLYSPDGGQFFPNRSPRGLQGDYVLGDEIPPNIPARVTQPPMQGHHGEISQPSSASRPMAYSLSPQHRATTDNTSPNASPPNTYPSQGNNASPPVSYTGGIANRNVSHSPAGRSTLDNQSGWDVSPDQKDTNEPEEAGMNWFSATSREGRDMLRSTKNQAKETREKERGRSHSRDRHGSVRSSKSREGRKSHDNRIERTGSLKSNSGSEWEQSSHRGSRSNSRPSSRPPSRPASRAGSVKSGKTRSSSKYDDGRGGGRKSTSGGRGSRGPLQESYIAKWNYDSRHPDELSFQAKDVIWAVQHADDEGWIVGIKGDRNWGMRGLVPITHLVNGDLIAQGRRERDHGARSPRPKAAKSPRAERHESYGMA